MSNFHSSAFYKAENFTRAIVSTSAGDLEVWAIKAAQSFRFAWRFVGDSAHAEMELGPEDDVPELAREAAMAIYQRTRRCKQPPDHPQYAREASERLLSKVCVTCQAPMDTPGHGVARLSFATVYSCPTLPKDAMCMLDMSGVFPGTEPIKRTKAGVLAGLMEMTHRGWLSAAQARAEFEKLQGEPERMEVRYEGPPPSEASAAVGQYPSATGWAFRWATAQLPVTPIATVSNRDGKNYLNGQLMEEGKFYDAGGVFPMQPTDWDPSPPRLPAWHPPLVPTAAMEAVGEAAEAKKLAASRRRHFMQAQRGDGGLMAVLSPEERQLASAEWSAQLRAKVEERKERDAEAARVTPYWSPEEQSGGDL